MNNNNGNFDNIDWGSWILTVIALAAFWPVGLVLLFRQLKGYSRRSRRNAQMRRPSYNAQTQAYYAQTAQQGAQSFTQQNAQGYAQQSTQGYAQQGAQPFTQQSAQGYAQQSARPFTQQGAQNPAQQNANFTQQGAVRRQSPVQAQYEQSQWYAQQQAKKTAQQQAARAVPQGGAAQNQKGGWETVKKTTQDRKAVKKKGGLLTVIGAGLSAVFGLATFLQASEIISDMISGYQIYGFQIQPLFLFVGFFCAGLMCLYAGHHKRKQAKRYNKYLSYIGKNQEVSISALSSAMGMKMKTVMEDLQDMLDDGVLPVGYIDVAEGMLVLSDAGIKGGAPEPAAEPEPEQVKKTVEDENAILQEIREVNDAIPDEVMSAKIDRIGEITGKILDYQRSHPSKSGQLRSFLNYYLPTTLKILRAYARLDAQGIEGENISAAKKRIENMMDQVVDGFEKQLDQLFADDALDITSDVAVLENMLRKDGLSGDGMTLGAAPEPVSSFSPQQAYLDLKKVSDELEAQTKQSQDDGQITLQL